MKTPVLVTSFIQLLTFIIIAMGLSDFIREEHYDPSLFLTILGLGFIFAIILSVWACEFINRGE